MAKLAESLANAIDQIVDNRPVYQDTTIEANIISVVNIDTGEYKVQYQSNIFSAFAQNTDMTYEEGKQVYVLVPSGDFSKRKIILGLANQSITYADKLDMLNYYVDAGPNWFSEGMYKTNHATECGICACPEDSQALLLTPANYDDIYFIRTEDPDTLAADAEVQWYGGMYEYLKISALFRTEFSSTHSVGNYSLKVLCEYSNPDYIPEGSVGHDVTIPQYMEIEYVLGFGEFTGSPYQYSQNTPQTAYFQVPKGTIKRLKTVQLWQDGEFLFDVVPTYTANGSQVEAGGSKVVDRNNIFCTDIDIRYADKVNLNDGLYHCWIETPIGDRVYKANPLSGGSAKPYVDLVPHFYYCNGDYVDDCEVRWFRRNSSIMESTPSSQDVDQYNKTWTDYTGPGWEPIENVLDDGLGSVKTVWNAVLDDGKTLRVYEPGVTWQWDYKCVCIYYKQVREDENETLIYEQAEHTVVNSSYDSKYALKVGDEVTQAGRRVLYVDNLLKSIKAADLDTDPTGQTPNRFWYCTWYLLSADNSYTRISDEMAQDPFDITDFLNKDILTFRVRAWDPYIVNPGSGSAFLSTAPVGEIEYIIYNSDDNAVATWDGDRHFNYDANGKAYDWIGIYDRKVKLNISFPNNNANGQNGGSSYSIRMIAPDGTTLMTQNQYETGENPDIGKGYTPTNGLSMMKNMYRGVDNTIHFKVLDQFRPEATQNTFTAEIRYHRDDSVYRVECPISFTKDGEQGTQGSDWTAPIYSTNVNPMINQSALNSSTPSAGAKTLAVLQETMSNAIPSRKLGYAVILDVIARGDWPVFDANNHVIIPNDFTMAVFKQRINAGLAALSTPITLNAAETVLVEDYYNFRTGQWQEAPVNDIIPSYHQRNDSTTPLILIPKDPNDLSKGWKQDPNNHVMFRPFVSKNGVPVEEMNPYDGYCYKVWWDVRFDARHKKAPYGSHLRLHHAETEITDSMFKWANDTTTNKGNGYEFGNATPGICREFISAAQAPDNEAGYYDQANGLIGYNAFPSQSMIGTVNENAKEQYGAVEVRFADDQDWTQFNFEDGQYVFFIKARIEVYANCWDENKNRININATSKDGPIATITAWHPVDVFLNPGNIVFDSSKFTCDWPTFVVYNSNGRNPVVSTSADGSSQLTAYYSDTQYGPDDNDLYKPRNYNGIGDEADLENRRLIIRAINNTPEICKITRRTKIMQAMNGGLETEGIRQEIQIYNPAESLNWQYGMITSLRTQDGGICNEQGQDLWKGGTYIRCQIMTLNTYGNTAINGWDGSSISLDKEKGVILAPTIGAGYKDKATNLFSGVIMGVDTQWKKRDLSENIRIAHGYDEADMTANPYLAGLYGYQRGASTFGLMENGTAFFGRSDRGGRIIIDGYNATMYGGANGWQSAPKYNDPMWNTMRLSFVDLYHTVDKDGTNTTKLGFEGEFYQESDFPNWLKRSWRNAYVVQKGRLPYWFQRGGKKGATLDQVTYWYKGKEDFDEYCKQGVPNDSDVAQQISYNARINYWDNGYQYQSWKEQSFFTWLANRSNPNFPVLNMTITDPTRRLQRLYDDWSSLLADYVMYLLKTWKLSDQYALSSYSSRRFQRNAIAKDVFGMGDWDNFVVNIMGLDGTVSITDRIKPYGDTTSYEYKVIKALQQLGIMYASIDTDLFQKVGNEDYTNQMNIHIAAKEAILKAAQDVADTQYENDMLELEKQIAQTQEGITDGSDPEKNEVKLPRRTEIYFDDTWGIDNCIITKQQSVFGPSRASTTPAIEIGQHVPGLRPGRISLNEYQDVMQNLEVPGDRNFMVTYDGTMWSMNGIFMGNVVGSNIIGGSIVGGDLAIGEVPEDATFYEVDSKCDWPNLLAPIQRPRKVSEVAGLGGAAEISPDGSITASKINIYNGNINIGGFHIIGYDPEKPDDFLSTGSDSGHLVQFGESDFIGPTHFYGNVGIGPNKNINTTEDWYGGAPSNLGNFFQTYGQVGMGVMIPGGTNLTMHKLVAGTDGYMSNVSADRRGNPFRYELTQMADTTPYVNNPSYESLEGYSMFGLNSITTTVQPNYVTQGHFWPMAFKYMSNGSSYFTTMNAFRRQSDDNIVDGEDGTYYPNYFRMGTWGAEATQVFFRGDFQNEYTNVKPNPENNSESTYGYVGYRSMKRWIDTGWGHMGSKHYAMGLTSWKGAHIVIKSDMDAYHMTKDSWRVYGSAREGANHTSSTNTWYDAIDKFGAFLRVGSYGSNGVNNPTAVEGTASSPGMVGFASRDTLTASGNATHHGCPWNWGGLEINPMNVQPTEWREQQGHVFDSNGGGVYLFSKNNGTSPAAALKNEVHIVAFKDIQGACRNNEGDSEVLVGHNHIGIYNEKRVVISSYVNGTAHNQTPPFSLSFTPTEMRVTGWTAEMQHGIYARFA